MKKRRYCEKNNGKSIKNRGEFKNNTISIRKYIIYKCFLIFIYFFSIIRNAVTNDRKYAKTKHIFLNVYPIKQMCIFCHSI